MPIRPSPPRWSKSEKRLILVTGLALLLIPTVLSLKKALTLDLTSVAFSPDGQTLLTSHRDTSVHRLDARTGATLTVLGSSRSTNALAFDVSRDGKMMVTQGEKMDIVEVRDTGTGGTIRRFRAPIECWLTKAQFLPDGKTLLTQSGTIWLWDLSTGKLKSTLQPKIGEFDQFNYIFSRDGQKSARIANSFDASRSQIVLIERSTGRERILKTLQSGTWGADFSPDSRILAAASRDGAIRLWNTRTGRIHTVLQTETEAGQVLFSPDGAFLASRSTRFAKGPQTVRLWDARNGRLLHTLTHTTPLSISIAQLTSMAFSPDSQTLVTASTDNTLHRWDVRSGQEKPFAA